ncbi:hypothetical protein AAG906_039538 [Vitis piasezkii]
MQAEYDALIKNRTWHLVPSSAHGKFIGCNSFSMGLHWFSCKFFHVHLVVLIHVDDIIVMGTHLDSISQLIFSLGHHFAIKDLRPLHYFLGIEVHHFVSSLHLNWHKYITDLLACTSMTNSKSFHSPMASGSVLSIHDGTLLEDGITPDYNLTCFTNPNHTSSFHDHQSINNYCVFMGSNLISWSFTKQKIVSRSTVEFEYRTVANGIVELSLIGSLFRELNIVTSFIPCIYCDNISVNYMTASPVFLDRRKHMVQKTLVVPYTPSIDQLADYLTKALPVQRFLHFETNSVLTRPLSLQGGVCG